MEELNMKEMDNVILLNDEEGNQVPFEFLDLMEYEGEEYVVLLPITDEEEGEVVILRVEEIEGNDEEESYVSVDDEELVWKLFGIFKEKFSEEFNFTD